MRSYTELACLPRLPNMATLLLSLVLYDSVTRERKKVYRGRAEDPRPLNADILRYTE